jgi:hypothetical protein
MVIGMNTHKSNMHGTYGTYGTFFLLTCLYEAMTARLTGNKGPMVPSLP